MFKKINRQMKTMNHSNLTIRFVKYTKTNAL